MADVSRLPAKAAPCPFAPGDVVVLKSGGHCMTVAAAFKDPAGWKVTVEWHNDGGDPQAADYLASMVEVASDNEK